MLVWISDLGMKKGFPEITGNPICGAKGTPAACWNSAIFSAFRNCGYLVGYLTGLFLSLLFSPCSRRSRASDLPSHLLDALLRRGGAKRRGPRLMQGFLACEARAQATGRSSGLSPFSFFFTSFSLSGFFFFSIFYISVTFTFFVKRV